MTISSMPNKPKRLRFPLNRQNKYRARISFQPIQVNSIVSNVSLPGKHTQAAIFGGILLLVNRKKKIVQKAFNIGKKTLLRGAGIVGGAQVISKYNPHTQSLLDTGVEFAGRDRMKQAFDEGNGQEFLNSQIDEVNPQYTLQYERLDDKCTLHVPVGLAFNDNVAIGSVNLGALGAVGLGAMGYGNEGLVSSFFKGASEFGKDFITAIGAGGQEGTNISTHAVALTAQRLAQLVPGQNAGLQSAVTVSSQVVTNPNTRSVFQNVNVRTFTFAFKFIPLSREESREVEDIITFFRRYMYPEHIYFEINADGSTQVPIGYKFPPLFDIKVGYDIGGRGERFENMPNMEIHYCYLQSVQHNYNSSSMSFFDGGKPTEIDMSLTFMEYRTLSRYDIDNEYHGAKDAGVDADGKSYIKA